MTRATRTSMQRISVAGQCVLIVLGLSWAIFERPAPFVNVRWRDGLSPDARREAEIALYLENGEPAGEAWRYELASPRTADIAAVIGHPAVRDTHRLDRPHAAISADAGRGTLRVWWAGPFKGARGRAQFRTVFAVVGALTLLCAWFPGVARTRTRGGVEADL